MCATFFWSTIHKFIYLFRQGDPPPPIKWPHIQYLEKYIPPFHLMINNRYPSGCAPLVYDLNGITNWLLRENLLIVRRIYITLLSLKLTKEIVGIWKNNQRPIYIYILWPMVYFVSVYGDGYGCGLRLATGCRESRTFCRAVVVLHSPETFQ